MQLVGRRYGRVGAGEMGRATVSAPWRHGNLVRPALGPATMRSLVRALAAQVGEHGEHAAVRLGIQVEPELEEDLLDVRLDGALGDEQAARR